MDPILRFDSVGDEEKAFLKKKEQELQKMLDEQKELTRQQLQIIENQKKELERQRWEMTYEKEFAIKQFQQMVEEAEREK